MLFSDRWKPLSRAGASGASPGSPQTTIPARPRGEDSAAPQSSDAYSRHSRGLEQFFDYIRGEPGLRLLDLSGASQANIGFITNLGHRLYSEDFSRSLDFAFGGERDFYQSQSAQHRVDAFLEQTLNFPQSHFDGALIWDALEFLAPELLARLIERLHHIVKPKAYLLAIFHAQERAEAMPAYTYRITDARTLLVSTRAMRQQPAQFFNNRAIEKLFQPFESVKFFLTRDNLREVIVKR